MIRNMIKLGLLMSLHLLNAEAYEFGFGQATPNVPYNPEPFSCDETSFVSYKTGDQNSWLSYVDLLDGSNNSFTVANVNNINSIGYNVKDNLIWGWNKDAQKVVRIDANRNAKLFDIPGLTKRTYVAADVSSDGILYLFSRKKENGETKEQARKRLVRVDLDSSSVLSDITLSQVINTADFAFNPVDGKIYFMEDHTDDLYSISISGTWGTVTKISNTGKEADPVISFFDKDGNFYYSGADRSTVYKTAVYTNSQASYFSTLNSALVGGDGARCPNAPMSQPPVPFTCDMTSFVSYKTGDEQSWLSYVDLGDGANSSYTVSNVNNINSIGYNVKDNLIWGWNKDAQKVVRIDAERNAKLFTIPGLVKRTYVAADVSNDGILYLYSRRTENGEDKKVVKKRLVRVDLDSKSVLADITLSKKITTADFAFNPVDGKIYFMEDHTDDLYSITISGTWGTVTKVSSTGKEADPIISFFDKDGNFYYSGADRKTVYRTSVYTNSQANYFSTLDSDLVGGDGARCPNAPMSPAPTPFTCDMTSFVSYKTGDEQSWLSYIDLGNGSNSSYTVANVNNINSIGYNVKDNLIWGWNKDAQKVVRIDADRNAKLVSISNLVEREYVAADVSKDGILYLYSRRAENGETKEEARKRLVRLDLNSRNVLTDITLSQEINTADFAFNPVDGKIYFMEDHTDDLYSITISGTWGTVTKVSSTGKEADPVISFFDVDGNFYFSGADRKTIYKTKVYTNSQASYFSDLDSDLVGGDGARCPDAPMPYVPHISFSQDRYEIVEGDSGTKELQVFIQLDSPALKDVQFDIATVNGTATAGNDFQAMTRSGTIAKGTKSIDVKVPIIGDLVPETHKEFTLELTNITGAQSNEDQSIRSILYIQDNDYIGFDVFDKGKTDHHITTKLVGEGFDLDIDISDFSSLGDTSERHAKLVDISKGEVCSDGNSTKAENETATISFSNSVTFPGQSEASKNMRVQFYWYSNLKGIYRKACSKDNFSIRPDRYTLEVNPDQNITAGDPFKIKITAVGVGATGVVQNYNENIDVYKLDFHDTKVFSGNINCTSRPLNINRVKFTNGVAEMDAQYDDVGELSFSVEEVEGHEYALVDKDDTPTVADRLIQGATSNNHNLIVADTEIVAISFDSDAKDDYVFYAGDETDEMAGELEFTIVMKNAQGGNLANFTNGCYATDVEVETTFEMLGEDELEPELIIDDDEMNNDEMDFASDTLYFTLKTEFFTNGKGTNAIRINFERAKDEAKNPMQLELDDMTLIVPNQYSEKTPLHLDPLTYIYLRANVPSPQTGLGTVHDIEVGYEVYMDSNFDDDDRDDFGLDDLAESADEVSWFKIDAGLGDDLDYDGDPKMQFNPYVNNITVTQGPHSNGAAFLGHVSNTQMKIEVSNVPYKDTVLYSPSKDYLKYDRFNPAIEWHSFKVDFSDTTATWRGTGDQGKTVDTIINKEKLNKLDW